MKLLIFDLDGTLVDSRKDISAAVNLTRAHYKLPPLPLDTVTGFVGNGTRNLIKRALQDTKIDIDEALRINMNFYMAHLHDETTPYPDVMEGLLTLHNAGHKLAVLSNKPAYPCRKLLQHFKILDLFSVVFGGDSAKTMKPDPAPMHIIMRTTDSTPAATWMIGDHHTDIEVARRAGTQSALAGYGFGQADANMATKVFNSFVELTDFFTS